MSHKSIYHAHVSRKELGAKNAGHRQAYWVKRKNGLAVLEVVKIQDLILAFYVTLAFYGSKPGHTGSGASNAAISD